MSHSASLDTVNQPAGRNRPRLSAAPVLVVLSLLLLDIVPQSSADGAMAERTPQPVPVDVAALMPEPVDVELDRLPVPAPLPPAAVRQTRAAKAITPHRVQPQPVLTSTALCLSPGTNSDCEATFVQALRAGVKPEEMSEETVLVTAASGSAEVVGPRGATPLHFQKRAPWVRRLETLGKEGIPFVRIPQGPENELVVGINRKGVLGFSLKQTTRK